MSRLSFLPLLLLAACAAKAPPLPVSVPFRDTETPIWSNAAFEPARLAGEWHEVAAFAAPGACRPGGAMIEPVGEGLGITGRVCLGGRETDLRGTLVMTAPGRLLLPGHFEPWWVLWVDTDYRTLAIGTPSGRFGFILNRGGPLPPDRLTAAREILDWNGYDLTRLTVF